MEIKNSHPLFQLLVSKLKESTTALSEGTNPLLDALSQRGIENISQVDLRNIAEIIDISAIAQNEQQTIAQPENGDNLPEQFHLFARTVPVRSSQLAGGSNPFLAGTFSEEIGPFIIDRQPPFFLDIVRTQRSVALFMQGNPTPVLYFKISFNANANPFAIPKQNTYTLVPGSVWIQAKILHTEAPAELYSGLKVSAGSINISGNFTTSQNGINLNAGTSFTCDLQLVQKALPAGAVEGLYGQDARDATIQLPATFSFTNNGVTKVGALAATVFGNTITADESTRPGTKYFVQQNRLGIGLALSSTPAFTVAQTQSPLVEIKGQTIIKNAWWALPLAQIQMMLPLEAEGNGALLIDTGNGLFANIKGTGNPEIVLNKPQFLIEPGRINLTDLLSNAAAKTHTFLLWKEGKKDAVQADINFLKEAAFIFNTLSAGEELMTSLVGFSINADRPVNIRGEAVALRSEKGGLLIAANNQKTLLSLGDFELLINKKAGPNDLLPTSKKMALALSNALLTTTLPVAVGLHASVNNDFKTLTDGTIEISFGLYTYLPTLPDPYTGNLGTLKRQFQKASVNAVANVLVAGTDVWMWVIAKVSWLNADDAVNTSFELLDFYRSKIVNNYRLPFAAPATTEVEAKRTLFTPVAAQPPNRLPGKDFEEKFIKKSPNLELGSRLYAEDVQPVFTEFALLDVSSNANQMGVAFSHKFPYIQRMVAGRDTSGNQDPNASTSFPLKIEGNAIITEGKNAQAFTLPGIAWEPLLNMSFTSNEDPLPGFCYFPNDGLPTIIGNLSKTPVVLAPIPLAKHLTDTFKSNKDGKTYALFNLPFGMVAFAILNQNNETQKTKPSIENVPPEFENAIIGGIQLELTAGSSFDNNNGQGLFEGYTFQLTNLYDQLGLPAKSTLGKTPTGIFNQEFTESSISNRPGVPVTNIGISGYGTSMASKWANDEAIFAQVSKAEFNVYTGRTSHELVQVVSKEYPFGAKLVRTITIFRMSNGYVARVDSGWKSQTPGLYDFSFLDDVTRKKQKSPFNFHPGVVKGVFNIRNIKEVEKPAFTHGLAELKAITYDADILIENVTEGGKEQIINEKPVTLVPSSGIHGYIQLKPPGTPVDKADFVALLQSEGGSIGGSINCVVKIAGTDQHIKINRFDVSPSVDSGGLAIFVSSARGSVFLPKDGSWSLVQHKIGNGNVTPLPAQFSVPVIKAGLRPDFDINTDIDSYDPSTDLAPDALHRIADPANILVTDPTTNNYGFLQNMGSQKVLFLTPSFKKGIGKLLSKTPPLLADSFKLLKGNAIFPNIGDASTNFGQAVPLMKAGVDGVAGSADAFIKTGLKDLGKDVFEILDISKKTEGVKFLEQGYQLAKTGIGGVVDKALKFDLPSGDFNLVNLPDKLVVAIRYKTDMKRKVDGQANPVKTDFPGKFDFDVDSLANAATDNWKGKMNNMAIVVSVGPMKELMTVKGNFNAQKGTDLDLGSSSDGFNLPTPEIEFSKEVEPVIRILEILAALSTGDYGAALKKGLKVAMSNSGDIWEYKFEASKGIPLVRFPPGPLYESPLTILKLECSLRVGFNVNAALKVTSDPTQLLPTAGAFFAFRGRLMVNVFSVGVGSIFAIGEAGIRLEADTSPQVNVILHFGFGAQIGVGLPVVGTATVTFMVGVEIATSTNGTIAISAFTMFKGQAELLAGLVCICIMIEARGTVTKQIGGPARCEVQVTFAIDVSIFLVINIHFSETWSESRQIA